MPVRGLHSPNNEAGAGMSGAEIDAVEAALVPCPKCKVEVKFIYMHDSVRGVECPICESGLLLKVDKISQAEKKQAIADAWKCWSRL